MVEDETRLYEPSSDGQLNSVNYDTRGIGISSIKHPINLEIPRKDPVVEAVMNCKSSKPLGDNV